MQTFDHEIDAPIDAVFAWGTTPENWVRSSALITGVEHVADTEAGTI
ncbi:MAG: hypothetical protein ABEJ35_07875 [Halobacteriaceae archaeon]